MERSVWCLALLLLGGAGWGEIIVDVAPGETLRLRQLETAEIISVDGVLDEPVWASLPAYDEFVVIEPDTLAGARHRTLVRFVYDEHGLYVGAEMLQPPDTLIARLSSRDDRGLNRDSINLTLDSSGTGRYGFWFGINLGDSLMDGTVLPERQFSNDWDGPWLGRSSVTDRGWSAEFFIPWSTLSMPAAGQIRHMGLYMSRKVAYLDERWGWPALPDTVPRFMSALQPLEMTGVAPRQQYNVYPFLATAYDGVRDRTSARAGIDVFWRPSSNFQLTATVNPDFGTVESDDVVINLSATETFFPEKRLFFLEGQEVFVASPRADTRGGGVGNAGTPYSMVYTRRIGGIVPEPEVAPGVSLPDQERFRPVDLLGAVKVTGQSGGLRYGALAAFEDDLTMHGVEDGRRVPLEQQGSDYGIARLLYEDSGAGPYRALGVLSTAVRSARGDAVAHGLDAHYLSAGGRYKLDGQFMTSDLDDQGRGYGGFLDFVYTFRRGMQQRLGVEYFDETFDINDLGFLSRNDHYRLRSSFILTRSDLGWARNNELDVRGFLQKSVSEDLFNGGGLFLSDRLTLHDLSTVTARLNYMPRQYDDLNSFGNGTYRIGRRLEALVFWDSDDTRRISYGGGGGVYQEHLGGTSWLSEAWLRWRPSDGIAVSLSVAHRDRERWLVHQSDDLFATFDARQWQPKLSLDYFLTARQQFRIALQWVGIRAREQDFFIVPDEPGDLIATAKPAGPGFRPSYDFSVSQFSFQTRYRWEMAPLSDLFLVYTRQADRSAALDREGFGEVFREAWHEPLLDLLVLKIRYRLGS